MAAHGEILVVDDERAVREGLAALFRSEGYAVREAADGAAALAAFAAARPDLVLLDVRMPCKSGYGVCEEIRARDAAVPIVFLSAQACEANEMRAFMLGADDWVPKTAPSAILLARVAAVLRRAAARSEMAPGGTFAFGGGRVDAVDCRFVAPGGEAVELTPRETEFLRLLAAMPGGVVSRDALMTRVWGLDGDAGDGALSVFVSRLRVKLGAAGACLRTSPRKGYAYMPPAPVQET